MDNKLDSIDEKIGKQGGIISDPTSSMDYYHNAQIYVLRGDRSNAILSIEKYVEFNESFIDPYLSYQDMLIDMRGRYEALRKYRKLQDKYTDNLAIQYALSRLLDEDEKIMALEKILEKDSQHLPAIYELSKMYSRENIANQTINDMQKEEDYLKRFKKHNSGNRFLAYYIKKESAQKIVDLVKEKLISYENAYTKNILKNPVSLNSAKSLDDGFYSLVIIVNEKATEMFYKTDQMQEFKSTGMMGIKDPVTGMDLPNYQFTTRKLKEGNNRIYIRYKAITGELMGPFEIDCVIKSKAVFRADSFIQNTWKHERHKKLRIRYHRGLTINFAWNHMNLKGETKYSFNDGSLNKSIPLGEQLEISRFEEGKYDLHAQLILNTGWSSEILKYEIDIVKDGEWRGYYPVD